MIKNLNSPINHILKNINHYVFGAILTLLLILPTNQLEAQVANYTFAASSGTYTALVAPTNVFPSGWDDNTPVSVPIGFTFTFNGIAYTSVFVHPNGYLSFGNSIGSSYVPISGGVAAPGVISGWGRDLQAQNTAPLGSVDYLSSGGVFTLQWSNARRYNGATTNTERFEMQIQLFQTSNIIKIVYGAWSDAISATTSNLGEVGLRGTTSADFKNLSVLSGGSWATPTLGLVNTATCFYNESSVATKPATGQTYTFTPPPPCVPPVTQPTALVLTPISISQINGTFTAASGSPDGYLVVRYPNGASTTNPTNQVNYSPGQAIGLGTVVQSNGTTSFSATGLMPSTTYNFYIYSYNTLLCSGGPVYNVVSPLAGSSTTLPCAGLAAGTYTVGPTGTYTSLTAVAAALSMGTAGPVIFELQNTYLSSVETFPVVFTSTVCPNNVTIRPQLGAVGLSITSSNATGTLLFDGGDNITFDGRAGGVGVSQLTIENTSLTGYTIQYINSATFNTIKYCNIKGVNTGTTSGVIVFSTATSFTKGNSNNTIDNCEIRDGATTPTNLIYVNGSATTYDIMNNNVTVSNCLLHDWFNASSTTAGAAINIVAGASDWNITNNSFYQTVVRTFTMTTATDQGAIFVASTLFGINFTISNNFIGGSAPLCAGAPWTYTGGATGTPTPRIIRFSSAIGLPFSNIINNTIANFDITTSSTSTASGMITHLNGNVNISNNTIGSQTLLDNIKFTLASTSTVPFFLPISYGTGAAVSKINVTDNNLGGITVNTNSTGTVSFRIIYGQPPALSKAVVKGNTVGGTVANSIQQLTNNITSVIMILNPTIDDTVSNNIIRNITQSNTGVTGSITGINVQASGGRHVITNNTISNLTTNGTNVAINNAASIVGITMTGSTVGGANISGNTIQNLTNTNTSVAGWINGMYFSTGNVPQPNTIVSKNLVHSISLASATGGMAGIFLPNTGIAQCFNNMVRLGIDSTGASITTSLQINGIYKASTASMSIYNNTVYIGGSNVVTGAVNSYAFRRSTSGLADTVMNNIFYNARSNTSGTGKHYASFLNASTAILENNNDLLANGTGGVLGLLNVTDYATLPLWQAATNQDWNSISSDPKLINPTGASSALDLHIQGAVATPIEQAGYNQPFLSNDFDLQSRASLTPVDIGADAGNFILSDIAAPAIYYTPLLNVSCNTGNASLNNVNITDATGIPLAGSLVPRIYYKKNAGSYFSQPGVFVSGSAINSFWNFTIVAGDMGGLVATDVVSYYIVAQDIVSTPNIGSNPAGVIATDVNTITTHPVTPNTYTINATTLSGTYTVGAAGVYPTLTSAISAYNGACLSGPVTFNLIDALYSSSETFPITINANPFASSVNTLTIKTTLPGTAITGLSATAVIVLNGADWVTIDGSVGNTVNTICPLSTATRDLTITNTSTSTTTAVIWLQSVLTPANGATNNTIKNINAVGSLNTQTLIGIGSGSSTISITSLGVGNSNNSIINNNVKKTTWGIYSQGSSLGFKNTGNVFNQNLINTTAPDNTRFGGIQLGFEDNAQVNGNSISNIANTTSPDIFGIALGLTALATTTFIGNEVSNSTVSYNQIGSISNTGIFSAAGITVANALSGGTNLIYNNMISGVFSGGTSPDLAAGIFIGGGPIITTKIYFNTISMSGTQVMSGNSPTFALAIGGVQPDVDIKNNVLTSTGNNGTGINVALGLGYIGTTGNYQNLISSNNDLFVSGTGSGVGVIGSLASVSGVPTAPGVVKLTLSDWQTETGRDLNSKNVLPEYVSLTDLHMQIGTSNNNQFIAGMGTSIPGITNDIDCQIRPTIPSIGADQFPCTYTSNALTFIENSGTTPNDGTICVGASATVVASGGVSYLWNTGATTATILVMPASTTSYTVTVTNSAGCTGSSTATVTVKSLPIASINPSPGSVCPGKSITLTASGGGTYLWSTGATTSMITVSPGGTTTYFVTVTNADGCTATASSTVTINTPPTAGITPLNPTTCDNQPVTLTASGGSSYVWSTGAITTSIIVNPAITTTYMVTVTGANGCTATASSTITVKPSPVLTETHIEPTTCISLNGSIDLTVAGGAGPFTYNWFTSDGIGLVNGVQDQTNISVGTYLVTVTGSNACSSTKSISLNGPGGCFVCPTIGGLSKSTNATCKTSPITLTATGLVNMGITYGITFKYSLSALPDPYVGGTVLGTVPNGGLSGGGTTAILNTSIPVAGNYFLYAILSPTPIATSCRPSANNTIIITLCEVTISDPCTCLNNSTNTANGQFGEQVKVTAPSGQIWTLTANTGLYTTTSPAPPSMPVLIPVGTILTEMTVGNGTSMYVLNGRHIDAKGYNVTVTNGTFTSSIGETCYYPNPQIDNLNATYCITDPPFTLLGSARLGDNSGAATGVGSFMINGVNATIFNPATLGRGVHTVKFRFDAADGVPNGSHPGCIQDTTRTTVVDTTRPSNVCPVALNVGCATDVPAPNPSTVIVTDNCPGPYTTIFVSDVITNQTCANRYTVTRTYRTTDAAGNSTTCSQTITVNDITHPSLICPAPGTVSCASLVPAPDPNLVVAADLCGNVGIIKEFVSDVITNQTCANRYTVTRTYRATDVCGNSGTCTQTITVNDQTVPVIVCKNITVSIPLSGTLVLTPTDMIVSATDNCGGAASVTLSASQTTFTCADLGVRSVTLRATDACGLFSTCIALVTVQDNILPVINCSKDYTVHLDPGECSRIINFALPDATDNCTPPPTVVQTGGLVSGSDFPRGVSCLTFKATDAGGNMATCTYCITVLEYANPIRELVCNDEVQISLDQNCEATINADMVLEGGPYGCYDDYIVQVRYWTGGGLIDRNLTKPGIQINGNEIGKELKITIIDPETGNSCWGHATVEDKLAPLLTCPRDTCLPCSSATTPSITGVPTVIENCGGASVSYRDNETKGGCAAGYELIIDRTWTAIDASGNKSTCVQKIMVSLGTLATVSVPRNYDNIEEPALNCNEKIDPNKNVGPHMSDFPECVDGYLLDSAYWRANPNQPNIYPNRRIPRVLGWNCIDDPNSPNYGHPSPDVVYYPAHRQWSQTNPLCWGPDTRVMWHGTGRPSGSNCSNLAITFQDIIFDLATPNCNAGPIGCYKVLRQWTVLDWCTSQVGGHNQIIKVMDQEGPQVLYPDSTRVNMETWTCTGRWDVPKPWILDNCSEELHYTVEVENGTVLGDEIAGFVVIDLPEGIQNGYIIAVDCCGNITKKRVVLNVLDKTPPQAVCRTRTVVSLNGNQDPGTNYARLYAKDLNEGSFDNCQPHVWYKTIRMAELLGTNSGSNSNNVVACTGLNGDDNVVLAGNQVYFDDYTQFCCADVGQKIMVVLRVFDVDPGAGPLTPVSMTNPNSALFGRFSDCMVEVEVQDKSVPTVVPPPNMVVSCWYWFDINKATDPNDPTFGRVVTSLSNRGKVKTSDIVCHKFCERNQYTGYPGYVQTNQLPIPAPNLACNYYNQLFDTAHWDRKYELVWGFDGYAINACGTSATIVVNDLRECGQGQIQRIITATGPNNSRVNAIQTIWVVDCDPFFIDPLNCNDPRYSDIQWPNGVCNQNPIVIDGCGADISPENPQLGKPVVVNNADDNCALISIEKFDEIFTIEPDACFKVLRKWVVIDWCQYDPFIDPNFGRWEALQVIKVRDQDKPVVTCQVGPCEPAVIDPTLKVCVGHISLTATATDNCTPVDWLFWEYKIDAYNDGKGIHGGWDYRVGTLTQRQYNAGDTVEYSHNPFADDRHNPFNASGTYPIGIHKIRWNVEDGCGNIGVCETLFEIKDCKAPTPYCLTGVITVPMPSSGCVDIWAKDLDHGSYDNCTPKDKLKIYFDGDANKPSLTICCDDFVNAKVNDELIINVEMWVEDEEGNKDYCKTIIVVQDNDSICLNVGSFAKITGNIMTEGNEEARPVNVQLERNARMMREMTGSPYSFGNLVVNDEYTIKPTRNDDHLNGVSTADIVKIQKHILGQTIITSPYKLIAADVNASGSITASDISEIRKLILGVTPAFTKVQSWTFVPSTYTFFDPTKPWTAPRSSIVIPTSPIEYKENFMAIKMGDVNGNAKAGLAGTAIRTTGTLNFVIEEGNVVAGQTYKMNVKSSDFANIAGYQFTMKYDNESLVYEGVERGSLNINESNIGTIRSGVITTSWNSNVGESYKSNEVLYSIVFKATRSGNISKMISITSDVTRAEAYDNLDQVKEVKLGVRTDKGIVETGVFELYQNEPNPFSKESVISYRLPEASAVKLTVYDVTGKVVRVYELAGQKGLNTYKITKSELNTSGVLYYQLDAADHTSTKRMIVVE